MESVELFMYLRQTGVEIGIVTSTHVTCPIIGDPRR